MQKPPITAPVRMIGQWDYLIVTASNDAQGTAYETQLAWRKQQGRLPQFRHVMVVTDPEGRRIGCGGSTLLCIMRILDRESPSAPNAPWDPVRAEQVLRRLRIMIIHAGGDSRRLPAYGPCGKIFIPVPGPDHATAGSTLFDRLLPTYLALPPAATGTGQVLVASGDVLLQFDPTAVRLDLPGLVALGAPDTPEQASKHGVFVAPGCQVERYLQKPSVAEQTAAGAVNAQGQTMLDIGLMSFDTDSILALLRAFGTEAGPTGELDWAPAMRARILGQGLDLYREICCALGTQTTYELYVRSARACGSKWDGAVLARAFDALHPVPLQLQVIPKCPFLHFGTTRQLIASGLQLIEQDTGSRPVNSLLILNSTLNTGGKVAGNNAWVEGCRINAPLNLAGHNVVVGADIVHPLALPENACLDIVPGRNHAGDAVCFVRCYSLADTFKDSAAKGCTFCGRPLLQWLQAVGAQPEDVWAAHVPADRATLWDARVFPVATHPSQIHDWLWMFDVEHATPEQRNRFRAADRYSAADVALLTDQRAFHSRRQRGPKENSTCAMH